MTNFDFSRENLWAAFKLLLTHVGIKELPLWLEMFLYWFVGNLAIAAYNYQQSAGATGFTWEGCFYAMLLAAVNCLFSLLRFVQQSPIVAPAVPVSSTGVAEQSSTDPDKLYDVREDPSVKVEMVSLSDIINNYNEVDAKRYEQRDNS